MATTISSVSAERMQEEMKELSLGDPRLDERCLTVVAAMAKSPTASFSGMCAEESEREGLYRFVRNERVAWTDLLAPHIEQTRLRAAKGGSVLVIHDTSSVRASDEANIDSLLSTKKKGFLAHASLVVDAKQERKPLGVIGVDLLFRRPGKAKTKRNGRSLTGAETAKLKNKEYDRWWRGIEHSSEILDAVDRVHVIDREGDCYELLARMQEAKEEYVVRWCKDRTAKSCNVDGDEWTRMRTLLDHAKTTAITREVHVSKRSAKTAPAANKASPARESRVATLRFSRCRIVLKKPRYASKSLPAELTVHAVRVFEPSPPDDEKPVEWVLLTTLPIRNRAAVERIVDIYRQRWLIEEFFKAIKSGCKYRKRCLTNRQSIVNTLALFVPIAWKALLIRQAAQAATSGRCPLSRLELKVLRAKAKRIRWTLSPHPTASEVFELIASLGGYRKNKRPPGWEVLMKGVEKLEGMVEGWKLATEM